MLAEDKIIQNLKDAGCKENIINVFISSSNNTARLRLLAQHRKQLLNNVHKYQKMIDCLDFLVYQMKNNIAEEF